MKKSGRPRAQRWFVEATTVVVIGTFLAQAAAPDSRAVELAAAPPAARAVPAAHQERGTPPAETYQERQDRIAASPTPLLAPLDENEGAETTCVSGEFTTLAVVFDSLVQSTLPSLPPALQRAARQQQKLIRRDMQNITVSTLAISEHPWTLGADDDDPAVKYRTPHSQVLLSGLLKIRDGKENEAIPVANITLSQAVETAWLYFFTTVLAPARFAVEVAPHIFDLSEAPIEALSFVSYSLLLTVGFAVTRLGLTALYDAISAAVLNQCVARVTDEQKDLAGKPSEDVVYDIPIHPIIRSIAEQLGLADSQTCTPIGDLSLGRIVTRTAEAAKSQTGPAGRRRIDAETRRILRQMRAVRIPHHLIPADPADFSTLETMGSYIGGAIPYLGGAPLDILIGLGHNLGSGANLAETVSLHDLTVTKSLTAAYYSYYLAVHLFTEIGDALTNPAGVAPAPFRIIGATLNLPLTYGLVTYHHVVRGMCLREDDTTGTGLGAEKNKTDYANGIRSPKTTTPRRSPSRQTTPSQTAPSRTVPARREPGTPKSTPQRAPLPKLPW